MGPSSVVVHDDRCTSNNRWKNLIDSTHAENMKNQAPYRIVKPAKYGAVVKTHGSKRSIHLGWFDTPEAANKAMVDYHQDLLKAA